MGLSFQDIIGLVTLIINFLSLCLCLPPSVWDWFKLFIRWMNSNIRSRHMTAEGIAACQTNTDGVQKYTVITLLLLGNREVDRQWLPPPASH